MAIFGRRKKQAETTEAPADGLAARRLAMYAELGTVSSDVLAPIISQHFMGAAPPWPSREGHRVITTDDGFLVFATDGLTDTFDDGSPGLGYELMTKVPIPAGFDQIAEAASLYEFGVHREMAFNALQWPDLRPILDDSGAMSMVLPGELGASPFVGERNGQGQVGALIGTSRIRNEVELIGITLILPAEVLTLESGGSETRPALARALIDAGVGWTSIANRAAVSI